MQYGTILIKWQAQYVFSETALPIYDIYGFFLQKTLPKILGKIFEEKKEKLSGDHYSSG